MAIALKTIMLLAGIGLTLLFILAFMSPFEALGWWSGWSQRQLQPSEEEELLAKTEQSAADYYAVYLTGIAGFSGEFLGRREQGFLESLHERIPNIAIIDDVFPFSVSNNPLDGERVLARFWGWVHKKRLKNPRIILKNLISIRNILQVAVSADPRYGPIYNVGVAREIVISLIKKGYPLGTGKPITIIGVSGGGQVALGTARYLNQALQAPIKIVSLAGVLSDDPGIAYAEHLYHLNGNIDKVPRIGAILYPGRWPILPHSAWNQALRAGRITFIDTGPMTHMGHTEYLSRSSTLPNGQTHAEYTTAIVAAIITDTFEADKVPSPYEV